MHATFRYRRTILVDQCKPQELAFGTVRAGLSNRAKIGFSAWQIEHADKEPEAAIHTDADEVLSGHDLLEVYDFIVKELPQFLLRRAIDSEKLIHAADWQIERHELSDARLPLSRLRSWSLDVAITYETHSNRLYYSRGSLIRTNGISRHLGSCPEFSPLYFIDQAIFSSVLEHARSLSPKRHLKWPS